MSAHLCKQIYSSWRQTRQTSPELTSPHVQLPGSYFPPQQPQRRSPSPEKRSMDSDRSDTSSAPMSRQTSNSSWRFNGH